MLIELMDLRIFVASNSPFTSRAPDRCSLVLGGDAGPAGAETALDLLPKAVRGLNPFVLWRIKQLGTLSVLPSFLC